MFFVGFSYQKSIFGLINPPEVLLWTKYGLLEQCDCACSFIGKKIQECTIEPFEIGIGIFLQTEFRLWDIKGTEWKYGIFLEYSGNIFNHNSKASPFWHLFIFQMHQWFLSCENKDSSNFWRGPYYRTGHLLPNTGKCKEVHVHFFAKEEAQTTFFYWLTFLQFTFYLFWVKVPLSQHRPPLLCSKMELLISHEDEWFDNFFAFLWFILLRASFLLITYIPRGKDTKSLFLVYNLLTTELQKVFYLPLFYCKDWSQLHYLVDMNLFRFDYEMFGYDFNQVLQLAGYKDLTELEKSEISFKFPEVYRKNAAAKITSKHKNTSLHRKNKHWYRRLCCGTRATLNARGKYSRKLAANLLVLLSSFVPNGFSLSIVSFLSIEKQMMLRMERATHHKSLINWAMEVFGKENLSVQMCIIRNFFGCEWPFLRLSA